jgi:two-component system LytT family response regulator
LYRILIIDDERAIRSVIKDIITKYIPGSDEIREADGVITGWEAIRDFSPDIVLLDIRMADGTGFDLLNKCDQIGFKVIFTTAFEEFAIRAFKYSAIDYILKPIDPDELANAIHKAGRLLQQEMAQRLGALRENLDPDNIHKKILLKTAENIYLVKIDDLVCCESDQVYTRLYLSDGKMIMVSRSLKEFEEMLVPAGFFRIHKSYMINMDQIDHFEKADGGFVVMRNGMRVPVASRKREQFLQMIGKWI